MKNYRINLLFIFIALSFITLQSCEKKELIQEINQQEESTVEIKPVNLSDIEIINGILVFDNMEEYEGLIGNSEISIEELLNWENEIGFISQQSILEQALAEEDKYYEQFDPTTMTEEERAKVVKDKEAMGYTEFTKTYMDLGLLKPYIYEDIHSLELTTNSKIHHEFLNLDGMVKIDTVIYQLTAYQCKQLTDGDFDKIELLKQSTESNENQNIKIGNLGDEKADWHGYIANEQTTYSSTNNYKMITYIKLQLFDYGPGNVRDFSYYMGYKNYKKNFWGNWKEDSDADTHVWGIVRVTVEGESPKYYLPDQVDNNRWSNHIFLTHDLHNVPYSKSVTFYGTTIHYYRYSFISADRVQIYDPWTF